MKIAVIGCNAIADEEHIPAYLRNPEAEIKYFCDTLLPRAQAAAQKYHCGTAVADYHDVLKDPEVTAVSVCTPNRLHPIIAIDAMRAGKHVLCEKPAARTLGEVLEMQKVQHETGMVLNIGVVNRYNDCVRRIRQYIEAGRLGEIYHVYVSFRKHRAIPGIGGSFTNKAVSGGGVLIDWGVHYLDIALYCIDNPAVKSVSGETFCKLGRKIGDYIYRSMWAENTKKISGVYDVEDSVTALVRTEGPILTVHGAWAQNIDANETYIDFMGEKGGVRLQYDEKRFTYYTSEFGSLVSYVPEYKTSNEFENEINDFLHAIQTGDKSPAHIDNLVDTARLIQAIYDSAEKHREIYLE